MGDVYDNLTGIRIASASSKGCTEGPEASEHPVTFPTNCKSTLAGLALTLAHVQRHPLCVEDCDVEGSLPSVSDHRQSRSSEVINGVLADEDLFALVMGHCSVAERAQIMSVCRLWNGMTKRGWKSITLQDPQLAKQITWLKRISQDTLEDLSICGSRYPPGATSMLQMDILSCITRFSNLKSIELEPDGRFVVSPSLIGQLSVLHKLDSLTASCTVPNSEEAADLSEIAVLTGLKQLKLGFAQQETHINLAADLSALVKLTSLRLRGAMSLQQQGGPCAGALGSLFGHLLDVDLAVQGDLEVELVAPMLTSARFSCVSLRSSHPAACSRLLNLELNSPPLHAEHVMGITALRFLTVAFGNKVFPSAIKALQNCRGLAILEIGEYDCGAVDSNAFEEFSVLTSLESLDLAFTSQSKRYSISPNLSNLHSLRRLSLTPRPEHQFSGGLHHLQSLSSATILGSYHGPLLQSASLVNLAIHGFEGFGFKPKEVLPLGDLPMLTSLRMSDALEADMSRFVRLESLTSLKELVVELLYAAASDPITTYHPGDQEDVTCLLASLHTLPALESVEIQAMRRTVVLAHVGRAHYKRLSLACADLSIPPTEAAALAELKLLRLVIETGHPETLEMLARLGASQKVFSAGDLYMCKELRELRLGSMQASTVMDSAHCSLKTVYDDGYFL